MKKRVPLLILSTLFLTSCSLPDFLESFLPTKETVFSEEEKKETNEIHVIVNQQPIALSGKVDYIFVDVFDKIDFDIRSGQGRAIATKVNGLDAQFAQSIHDGDRIEIYWKEN